MILQNDGSLTISRMASLIRQRKISPVELTEFFLNRIDRLQPKLNAFITITADLARKQAKRAEKEILKGHYRGPLHGIPVTLKDLFYTAGVRTTAGSKILRRFIPQENALVVDRLFAAGAILLGKTNLHEFAYGVTNNNPHYGPVHNPWDLSRIPGGSSGGSAAAVSAGLCLGSLGTDTGGSIRIPSAACGTVGLKPTRGLVPLQGVIPLASSLDHVGPICRCVEDAALMFEAIAGPRWAQSNPPGPRIGRLFSGPLRQGIKRIRVGIPRQYFFDRLQKDVRRNALAGCKILEQMGAELREVELKGMEEVNQLVAAITLAKPWPTIGNGSKRGPRITGQTALPDGGAAGGSELSTIFMPRRSGGYLPSLSRGFPIGRCAGRPYPAHCSSPHRSGGNKLGASQRTSGQHFTVYPLRESHRLAGHFAPLRVLLGKLARGIATHRSPVG